MNFKSLYCIFLAMAVVVSGISPVSASVSAIQLTTDIQVNLNKARVHDLVKVQGITALKAKTILAYRKKNGEFKSVDDLAKVRGFDKLRSDDLRAIEAQLTTE